MRNIKQVKSIVIFTILFTFIVSSFSFAENNKNNKKNTPAPFKILIARINVGKELPGATPGKVQAAFAFSMFMGQFFDIIPPKFADSVSLQLQAEGRSNSILELANHFSANYIAYIDVNRFVNILRTDITLLSGKDYSQKSMGTGYSFVNFRDSVDSKLVYDPSLTTSIQRAFAVAIKDSNIFSKLNKPVFPTKNLVISGIEFKNNAEYQPWELFTNEVANSYFILESIFTPASKSKHFVIFDFDTRDSIYATFKFYSPENYKAPNQMELYALRQFEIQNFITGSFQRTEGGAELILILEEFTSEGISEKKRVKGTLANDSKVELEKFVEKLTNELLEIQETN